ncbi:MAG TPA: type I-U CRISPR-associated protein Csb2 [Methanothrix sp.]|nr:type I-U CRISPR-associated protein Csb2 [Methanothrix sp.]
MSSSGPGAEARLSKFLETEEELEAVDTSRSFEDRVGPPATAKSPVFDDLGRRRSRPNFSGHLRRRAATGRPTAARFFLFGSRPAPRLTDAITLAERVHAALVELSDGSPTFTGCDDEGRPLSGHIHAYVLPESIQALGRGRGGEVTSVIAYAPAGFGSREIGALEALREVGGSGLDVQLALSGLGRPENFGGTNAARGESPLLAESRSWVSRTPFIPTRHPKATRAGAPKIDPTSGIQIGSPEHELLRLLGLAGFPEPVAVERVSFTEIAGERVYWSSFRRARTCGDGRRAGSAGYGFRIEFAESVRGPVALGYGAHFGMGGFEAEKNRLIEGMEDE